MSRTSIDARRPRPAGPYPHPTRTVPAPEKSHLDAQFCYRDEIYDLTLSVPAPSERLVKSLRDGEAEFALVIEEPLVLLCYRFGTAIPWSSVPLRWWDLTRDAQPPDHEPAEARALLCASLIEAEIRMIRACRNVTLSLDFSRALNGALREQARIPFDPKAQDRALDRLRRRCPTTPTMVAYAAVRSLGSH
jgi:hypothetical protein